MKNRHIEMSLVVGIIALFIISSVSPVVISYNHTMKRDECLENLTYICNDERGVFKFEFYKDILFEREEYLETDKETRSNLTNSGISDGLNESAWPMKCHDTHHTGLSPYSTADNPYDELWRYESNYIVDADPSIGADGTIYVGGGYDGLPWYLFAIYPNGTLRWRYYASGLIKHMCPAIADDGTIYIGTFYDDLIAINQNGTEKWKFDAGNSIVSDPAIGEDGVIYFGVMGPGSIGRIYAIYPDGTEKWHYDTGYWITSDPAIGDDGTIYIGSGDHYFYALYPNGTLRWRFPTGDIIKGPASIAEDGTVYISSYDDYLYAIYPNGTLRWKTEIWIGSDTNPSIGPDGTIYICSASKLFAISPDDGDIEWEFDFGGTVIQSSSAICADGIIYTGIKIGDNDGGEIVAVNPDGTERWRERISNRWVDSSPCIGSDGTVYINSARYEPRGCSLHAFGEPDQNAPEAPTITGETDGKTGVEYDYTVSTTDPNGDDVYYYVDWGDGEFEDWFGPFASGEEIIVSHTWEKRGTYIIRVRAKDTDNLWGPWGELEVKMPVNQHPFYSLFLRFLERFPNAFPILRNLLWS